MMQTYLEMAFSVADGIFPFGSRGIFTDREGFLYSKRPNGKFIPLKPNLGNRAGIGKRGAYFYFQCDGEKYKVYQEEIQEHGLKAPLHKINKG
jgi:hypothetical protein